MCFLNILISTILLMTVLHEGITNENLNCVYNESRFKYDLEYMYLQVSE